MNYLVTGGAGYIGSVIASQLCESGHRVTVYDNLSKGNAEAVPKAALLVQGDVGDSRGLDEVLSSGGYDGVLHFAASIEAGESMRAPELFFRNNTLKTLTLLETMLRHKIKVFVFSSTAALYGMPDRIPIEEDAPLRPVNAYGESKLLVERVLQWYYRLHGLSYASLRYFNAAGAAAERGEAHMPETHLIPLVLQAAAGKRPSISIYGTDYETPDGTCIRDYIHVSDLASAHLMALAALADSRGPQQLIYNLGNGRGSSVREVIETARRVTGRPIPARECPRREGDPAVLVASSEKIQRELGWKPKMSRLDEIIQSAWDWMRAHPHGYAPNVG